jgi:DUF4097 and DUF4098 domain-containing protein YvlB
MKLNRLQIIAAICLVLGLGIFLTGFAMLDFDVTKLSTEEPYESKSYETSEAVRAISIDDRNADIEISPSRDSAIHVIYNENDQASYVISVKEGELIIQEKTHRKWYDYLFVIQLEQPKLYVEVPQSFKSDIAAASHGSVTVKGIVADDLLLTASDDRIEVKNVTVSGRMDVKTTDAGIYVSDTTVTGDIVCRTSGDRITLDGVRGKSISAENSDGRISLQSVTSAESIRLKTSSDDIRLAAVEFRDEMTCTVSDGNVKGSIAGRLADYSVTCKAVDGKSTLPESMSGGDKRLNIRTTGGNIDISFFG